MEMACLAILSTSIPMPPVDTSVRAAIFSSAWRAVASLSSGERYAGMPARRRHTNGSLSLGTEQQVNWIARHLQTKSGAGSASASTTCMPSVIARPRSMFAPRDRSQPGSNASHVDGWVLDAIAEGADPLLLGVERGVVELGNAGHRAGQIDAVHHDDTALSSLVTETTPQSIALSSPMAILLVPSVIAQISSSRWRNVPWKWR